MQADPPPTTAPFPSDHAHWTPARQRIFLAALLELGSVAAAARAAGMSRSGAHRLRARLPGTPFVALWDHALAEHRRRLADPFARPASVAPARDPAGAAPSPTARVASPPRRPTGAPA